MGGACPMSPMSPTLGVDSAGVHSKKVRVVEVERRAIRHTRRQSRSLRVRAHINLNDPCEQHSASLFPQNLDEMMGAAAKTRDQGFPRLITFSPKVFIPLTRLCRDSCGYCTFALPPVPGKAAYMTIDEVVAVAQRGANVGCTEALFTLGDKPELRYQVAAQELREMGYERTVDYVAAAAKAVLETTGLLPHINGGVVNRSDLRLLKSVSVSQGMMIESSSNALLLPGQAHYDCPDKIPDVRMKVLEAAGEEGVPFTTGLLVGIGESREDRIRDLIAIKTCHERYGHIQEVIIQNFRAKKNTRMSNWMEPSFEEVLWTVAAARSILGPHMSIQAPPNLSDGPENGSDPQESWKRLIDAGINDWGGVSPVTRDYVNPERPWPHVDALAQATALAGKQLVPRLPVYPNHLNSKMVLGDGGPSSPLGVALRCADSEGLARASSWYAGAKSDMDVDSGTLLSRRSWTVSLDERGVLESSTELKATPKLKALLDRILDPGTSPVLLNEEEISYLFSCRGDDFDSVIQAADTLRQRVNGNEVTYVVNRNINYTNMCTFGCKFCAFSKAPSHTESLRGAPYLLSFDEIARRSAEAWERGATEVCMQGGIHPEFTGATYLRLVDAAKKGAPNIHVHAFSPLEVRHGAESLGWSVGKYLGALRDAGLGSLPGTAAEVLDDRVREVLCPDKLNVDEWLEVIHAAHTVAGLKTSSTIMFGHIDSARSWARHLILLRDLQLQTGGFTEFVPLPFVHMEAPIFRKGKARAGPTLRECMLMHAVARLALHPHITNIQASWVKMGPDKALQLLGAGCNDLGGTLMNESITRAAGAAHGQELGPLEMEAIAASAGRRVRQRTTLYQTVHEDRRAASFCAKPLR